MSNTVSLTTHPCLVCKASSVITITEEERKAYNSGLLVQEAFPTRDDDFRELIITGTHPKCWDEMMEASEEE
jgi:cell division protein FtsL